MAGLIYLVLIFAIIAGVGALFYLNVVEAPAQLDSVRGFLEESRCFPDGSCVNLLITDEPQSIDGTPIPQEVDVPKIVKDEQTGGYNTVTETIVVQGEEGVPQISKEDPRGVEVQGYVLLKDATTGNSMKPYIYSVLVTIECDEDLNIGDEGYNYCSTTSIFGRVETTDGGKDKDGNDLGGYFKYVWHPKYTDTNAFYDVSVLVTSDNKNSLGQYENYENTYKIQVISK